MYLELEATTSGTYIIGASVKATQTHKTKTGRPIKYDVIIIPLICNFLHNAISGQEILHLKVRKFATKIHLAKFFYTTSGFDGCDKYKVWSSQAQTQPTDMHPHRAA